VADDLVAKELRDGAVGVLMLAILQPKASPRNIIGVFTPLVLVFVVANGGFVIHERGLVVDDDLIPLDAIGGELIFARASGQKQDSGQEQKDGKHQAKKSFHGVTPFKMGFTI
jgi:hypothetical protein